MQMVDCTYGCVGYRFGFQGQEKDDEVKGNGNSLDFGARIYDPRVGRWMSVDPDFSKYPWISPYNFVSNSPISRVDPSGKGDFYFMGIKIGNDGKEDNEIYLVKDDDIKLAQAINQAEGHVYKPESGDYSRFIKLPAKKIREGMVQSVDRTVRNMEAGRSGQEEGGFFGTDGNGDPGFVAEESGHEGAGEIDPYNAVDKEAANDMRWNGSIDGTYHTHDETLRMNGLSGAVVTAEGPSDFSDGSGDLNAVKSNKEAGFHNGKYSFVLDAHKDGGGNVYIFDEGGTKATMPVKAFRKITEEGK